MRAARKPHPGKEPRCRQLLRGLLGLGLKFSSVYQARVQDAGRHCLGWTVQHARPCRCHQNGSAALRWVPSAACAHGEGSRGRNNSDKAEARLKQSKPLRGFGAGALLDPCGARRARRDAGGGGGGLRAGPPSPGERWDALHDN